MEREAFCVKCRQKRPMIEPREIVNRRKVRMLQGDCGTCNKKINTFIRKPTGTVTFAKTRRPPKGRTEAPPPSPEKPPSPRSTGADSS